MADFVILSTVTIFALVLLQLQKGENSKLPPASSPEGRVLLIAALGLMVIGFLLVIWREGSGQLMSWIIPMLSVTVFIAVSVANKRGKR